MVDKASCISVCYQHQLRPFIECKIVVLRRLSIYFFDKVILKALLQPNSNIQKYFVTLSQAWYTQLVFANSFSHLMTIEYKG